MKANEFLNVSCTRYVLPTLLRPDTATNSDLSERMADNNIFASFSRPISIKPPLRTDELYFIFCGKSTAEGLAANFAAGQLGRLLPAAAKRPSVWSRVPHDRT
jgi:hypothetical protein